MRRISRGDSPVKGRHPAPYITPNTTKRRREVISCSLGRSVVAFGESSGSKLIARTRALIQEPGVAALKQRNSRAEEVVILTETDRRLAPPFLAWLSTSE